MAAGNPFDAETALCDSSHGGLEMADDIQPPADATLDDDLDQAIGLIFESAPRAFDYMFGGDLPVCRHYLTMQWTSPYGLYYFGRARVLRQNQRLVGLCLSGVAAEWERPADPVAAQSLVRDLEPRLGCDAYFRFLHLGHQMAHLMVQLAADSFYIQTLAVLPQFRGRGLGKLLLDDALARAADRGLTGCSLDVFRNNPARYFYRRFGFQPVAETCVLDLPRPLFSPMIRMIHPGL